MGVVLDQHYLQPLPGRPGELQRAILSARPLHALGGEDDSDGFPFFQDGLAGDDADVALLHLAVGHAGSRQALLGSCRLVSSTRIQVEP